MKPNTEPARETWDAVGEIAREVADSGRVQTFEGIPIWLDWFSEPVWLLHALNEAYLEIARTRLQQLSLLA